VAAAAEGSGAPLVDLGRGNPEVGPPPHVVERLAEVAGERGVPSAQVALAWLLSHPVVTAPIVGATKLSHLDDAIAATELTLDEKEIERLEAPYVPHPVLGH
jgi:aryl-alcohol dehydrogenase-like predicted oxidoreductase